MIAITLIYTIFLLIAVLVFCTSRCKLKWSLFCIGIVITYFLNVPAIVFYLSTGSQLYFSWGANPEDIYVGSLLNLVFTFFWMLGYMFVVYIKRKVWSVSHLHYTKTIIFFLFALSLCFYVYRLINNYGYGHAFRLYSSSNLHNVGAYGIIGAFSNLTPVLAATLLIDFHSREKNFLYQKINNKIYFFMWSILFIDIAKGIAIDMQRGDVLQPIILIVFVLMVIKLSNKVIFIAIFSFFVIMTISPFLDILRKSDDVTSVINLQKKVTEKTNVDHFSIMTFAFFESARKCIAPETSFALKKYADREGTVGINPYLNTLIDPVVPRILWNYKPIKRSIDGSLETYVPKIAAKEFGMDHLIWTFGGGEMYWQFGWVGVVLGGCLVGFAWAYLLWRALTLKSFFMVVILLSSISWGAPLIRAFDEFLYQFLSSLKTICFFWLLDIMFRIYKRNNYLILQ